VATLVPKLSAVDHSCTGTVARSADGRSSEVVGCGWVGSLGRWLGHILCAPTNNWA
jgi:hypothetical protein